MRRLIYKILPLLCVVCLLVSMGGDLGLYALAQRNPVVLTRVLTASDEQTYVITVSCEGDESFPEDAELLVSELLAPEDGTEAAEGEYTYGDYVEQAAEALDYAPEALSTARVFDISMVDRASGAELQPSGTVKVSIRLLEENLRKEDSIGVVHFGEEPEVLASSLRGEDIEFETGGFSVYVVLKHEGDQPVVTPRVEFHFLSQNYTEVGTAVYSAPGYEFVNKHLDYQISQILTNGEGLEMIANPPNKKDAGGNEASFFYGWYTVDMRSDSTAWDSSTGQWTGAVTYTWPEPQKLAFEKPLTITDGGSPAVREEITWAIGSASGTAELDAKGTAHVYLVPVYEDFYFVNYHMGHREADPGLRNNLLTRRLVVFGSNTTSLTRIGDVQGPSPDPAHQIFAGWETVKDTDNDGVLERDRFYQTLDSEGKEITVTLGLNGSPIASAGTGFYVTVEKDTDPDALNYLDLYPVFAEARWLYYNLGASGNGAVYVPAAYRLTNDEGNGTSFDKLAVTTRPGYDFQGWYFDACLDGSTIANLNLAPGEVYDQVLETTENGVTTTTTTHYAKAFQLTDDAGDFVNDVKGKAFYAKKSEYGVDNTVDGGSTVTVDRTVHTYVTGIGSEPGEPLAEGDEWLKLFEITDEGKLYTYKDLDELNVCARWGAKTVKYTVVYWLENANDDDYTLMYYKTVDGTAGEMTAAEATKTTDTATREVNGASETYQPYTEYKLKFAHLSTDQDKEKEGNQTGIQQQTIEGDGSTIVNVYYDRNVYTLRFDIGFAQPGTGGSAQTIYTAINQADAASYAGTVYGMVDGNYVALTSDGNGGYIYTDDVTTRHDYSDYRFQQTTGNIGTQYGVVGGNVVELSGGTAYVYNWQYYRTYWRNAGGNTTLYVRSGNSYVDSGFTTSSAFPSDSSLNGYYIYNYNDYREAQTNGVSSTVNSFTYNGGTSYGNGTRFLRVENEDANTSYTLGFIDGSMQTVSHDAQGWYYNTQDAVQITYEGSLYVQAVTMSGAWTYYISYITNASDGGGYGGFLTTNRYNVNAASDPFTGSSYYTGRYQSGNSVIFYYDLTAKFGEKIKDRWPAQLQTFGNYGFIGWIQSNLSKIFDDQGNNVSSLKGQYEIMSEDVISVRSATGSPYEAIPADQGIAHEFHCRYNNGTNTYVYRQFFWNPETQSYADVTTAVSDPDREFVARGGTGSHPRHQTQSAFDGYNNDGRYVVTGGENGSQANPDSAGNFSGYTVTMKDGSTINNAMIMRYYYKPKLHYVSYVFGSGASSTEEIGSPAPYYYNQSLANANIYNDAAVAATPVGYSFSGWYENPDGVGNKFNFNTTMPDGDLILYAVYKPLRYRVEINPNGAEIDHIDHTGAAYTDGYNDIHFTSFAPFNREATTERPADSGYNRSQATYFNGTYNEMVGEYAVSRNYVPISDAAAETHKLNGGRLYCYVNMQFKPSDGSGLPSDLRSALYVDVTDGTDEYVNGDPAQGHTELYRLYEFFNVNTTTNYTLAPSTFNGMTAQNLSFAAWKALYVEKQDPDNPSSPLQLFRKCNSKETWVFLGWFKDGETMPYNFSEPVKGSFRLTARWRLDGGYRILYTPEYSLVRDDSEDPDLINGHMDDWVDPPIRNAQNAQNTEEVLSYTDGALTTVYKQPTNLTRNGENVEDDSLIFRGWQVVNVSKDSHGNPVYTPADPGVYYDPGDDFVVRVDDADTESIIHMQAVYEDKSKSYRRPEVTNVTLSANSGYLTDASGADLTADTPAPWGGVGTAEMIDGAEEIRFLGLQANAALPLKSYAVNPLYFKHSEGYFLLGFDRESNPMSIVRLDPRTGEPTDEPQPYVANYPADSIVSLRRLQDDTLYAVWEPMVYMTFVNETEGDVTVGLDSENAATLTVINVKNGMYDRTPLRDLGNIVVPAGDSVALAFPFGAEKKIEISGTNTLGHGKILYWNTKLIEDGTGTVYDTKNNASNTPIEYTHGDCTHLLAKGGDVDNNTAFAFEEKLLVNREGLIVTFTSKDWDRTLVFDDNYPGGGTQEQSFANTDLSTATATVPATGNRFGYELKGWAWSPTATDAVYVYGDVIDNLSVHFGDETILRLYAVWAVKTEPYTVYVYKTVPEPGSQSTPFTFTVAVSGTFRYTSTNYTENLSDTGTFTLSDGEYAKLVAEESIKESGAKSFLSSTVTVFDKNGAVDPARSRIVKAEATSNGVGSFDTTESFTVTEDAVADYTPTVSVMGVSSGYTITSGSNSVHWADPNTGGSVMFTNTIDTYTVTVRKTLHDGTLAAKTFSFSAEYTFEGKTKNFGSFPVISGTPNDTVLTGIPAGAELTVTETPDDKYITKYSLNGGGAWSSGNSVVLENMSSDQTVDFDNTLESHRVRFIKTDQDGNPGVLEALFKLDAEGYTILPETFIDDDGVGLIYEGTLYVGQYTLTETWHDTSYIGLDTPVTVTVSGNDADPLSFSDDRLTKEYDSANDIWIVKVKNRAMKTLKVKKVLSDPLVSTRVFTFDYSYYYNGRTVSGYFQLSPTASSPAEITVAADIPVGATSLTVTERDSFSGVYDTTWSTDNGTTETAGRDCVIGTVTKDETVIFTNTRKEVEVTVKKVLDDDTDLNNFTFTATLSNGTDALQAYPIDRNGTPDVDTDDASTDAAGKYVFYLGHNQEQVLTVPLGAELSVAETAASSTDAHSGDVDLSYYVTTASAGSAGGTYTPDSRTYTLTPETNAAVTFRNGSGGVDIRFLKIDGFGNALNGAAFSLFTDADCTNPLEISGTSVTGTSAAVEGKQGVVALEKIPFNVYYMKETTPPSAAYNGNSARYILLVGDKALAKDGLDAAAEACLENITAAMITAQTEKYLAEFGSDYGKYAIFRLDDVSGKAVTTPDIGEYGILNVSSTERKAILKKSDDAHTPLHEAVFDIYRVDRTLLAGNVHTNDSGVFWTDFLPFGVYYVHETAAPDGFAADRWFTVTVNDDSHGGVTCSLPANAAP